MTEGRKAQIYFVAFLLLASTMAVAASVCARSVGPVEEHFELGQLLHDTGSLGARLLRPPGFPAFVAVALWTRDAVSAAGLLPRRLTDDVAAAILAQRLALLLCCCVLFRQALRHTSPLGAFCLATLFSVNPLSMVLSGVLSYPLLDMLLVCLGTLMLARVGSGGPGALRAALAAGVMWGVAALVRPVALVLPVFVFGMAVLLRPRSWRRDLRVAGALALGMALIVGPYTLRNFMLIGRWVPVCAQGGFALWGSSVETPAPGEAYIDWPQLWYKRAIPLYAQVTGSVLSSTELMTQYAPELNEAFGRAALANIARNPGIYLSNVANNLWRFPVDPSEWWWLCYLWTNAGEPMTGNGPALPTRADLVWISVANVFVVSLSLAGLAGLVLGLVRSDPWAEPVAAVFAVLWAGNSLTFSLSRYTYCKLPLLILGLGMLLRGLGPAASSASPALARRSMALAGALLALGLGASLGLILTYP